MADDSHSSHAKPETTALSVSGMTCGNCARKVTEAIQSVPGVRDAAVSLDDGRAVVKWKQSADPAAVVEAIKRAGFQAKPGAPSAHAHEDASNGSLLGGWKFNVIVGSLCTVPLMIGEWVFHLGMETWFRWAAFALATMVQFSCGGRFYRGAWQQLKRGRANMDLLVALGSTTAYGYSVWALLARWPGHVYFMEAAAIITIISVGHWLEARTGARAETSLRALLNLAPAKARRMKDDDSIVEVPVSELRIGDAVLLKPGDKIPTDGEVLDGDSAVDEAMLTGESVPVEKERGNQLYAGTINLNGRLVMQVTAKGEDTALAHIIATVRRAQQSRARIQRLADRVSNVFVPIVVLVAIGTALWWGLAPEQARAWHNRFLPFLWPMALPDGALAAAFIHAAAVLIVACPCAMGLATPVAIMAGTNSASRRGILIRDGIALEQAGRITAVMLDKTGTLTEGKPVVANQESFLGGKRPVIHDMKLAAALARPSHHPLSQAVARLFPDEFSFTDWEELRGRGVQARLMIENYPSQPAVVRLGSLAWLQECGVDLERGQGFAAEWMGRGGTILGIAVDQWLMGTLAIQDELKPGARDVVRQLRRKKLNVHLVTGDNRLTAEGIAKQIGIAPENVFAEVKPEKKAELVRELQQRGERVAFIGDGINDAPALETADLGIAVSRASDVAREAADIILLNSDIRAVPESLGLAQATLRTIRQNLFWAFFYNAAAVPLAALGFLSPLVCALAMGLSDLVVIGNALRLLKWRLYSFERFRRQLAHSLDIPEMSV